MAHKAEKIRKSKFGISQSCGKGKEGERMPRESGFRREGSLGRKKKSKDNHAGRRRKQGKIGRKKKRGLEKGRRGSRIPKFKYKEVVKT